MTGTTGNTNKNEAVRTAADYHHAAEHHLALAVAAHAENLQERKDQEERDRAAELAEQQQADARPPSGVARPSRPLRGGFSPSPFMSHLKFAETQALLSISRSLGELLALYGGDRKRPEVQAWHAELRNDPPAH